MLLYVCVLSMVAYSILVSSTIVIAAAVLMLGSCAGPWSGLHTLVLRCWSTVAVALDWSIAMTNW
jgi:hypothetical protein